jgi:hypothetical protein
MEAPALPLNIPAYFGVETWHNGKLESKPPCHNLPVNNNKCLAAYSIKFDYPEGKCHRNGAIYAKPGLNTICDRCCADLAQQ